VAKAKYSKNYFTLSYSQALFLDYNKKNEKEKAHNYEVSDIIKEENESFSPKYIDKIYLGQSNTMSNKKKKPEKNSIKDNSKFQNKSFCKTEENNTEQNKNLIKEYTFNKKSLINNHKFKIPKTKLSMEIRNKRKTFEKKECKNYLDINNRQKSMKSGILSPKFLKMKLFLEQIHKFENSKNKYKDKSKKFRKKEKINGKKNSQ
jgi:nicotinamide riboside kinase